MVKIKTVNGIYEVAKPGGKMGARNMSIIAKLSAVEGVMRVPEGESEDPKLIKDIEAMNARLMTKAMFDVFEIWAAEILPFIVKDGPYKYAEMPGEDQMAIFMAMSSELKMADEFFQIIPDTPA